METRCKGFKFDNLKFKTEIGKNLLTNRAVDERKKQIGCVIEANSIETFER